VVNLKNFYERFQQQNAELICISSDSPEIQQRTVSENNLPFPLYSDASREVIRYYGVLNEQGTLARPSTFVIDKQGVVRFAYVRDDPGDRPMNTRLLGILRQANQS